MDEDPSLELFPAETVRGRSGTAPLADRMRPRHFDEVAGQEHLTAPGAPLRVLAERGALPSLILWGPPGSGKTTLARLLADAVGGSRFVSLSAVEAGVKQVRQVVERAARTRAAGGRCVLFLDEIHRFNRAQQDALLPHVETGALTLIGATTENPSFEVVSPLLSRCRVFTLRPLSREALAALLERALADPERGLGGRRVELSPEAREAILDAAEGDARRALSLLEAAHALDPGAPRVAAETVGRALGQRVLLHDRDREEHYNVVSALIKSLRASDPDAALYYLARMLEAGEDPLFIARRLIIFASEDVGNAEPEALPLAVAASAAVERVGMPEGRIPLAQAVSFLACAPKSNAAYAALGRASQAVRQHGSLPVPLHLRNAATPLLRQLGYGAGYRYPHDEPDGFVATPNLPEPLAGARFYEPKRVGAEAEIEARLSEWRRRRAGASSKPEDGGGPR